MKILHVITSLQYGGAEKLVAEIVPMLRDSGNEVDVCAFDDSEPNFRRLLVDNGIKVTFFGKGYYSLKYLFRLVGMMKDYDIIHTHNSICQLYAAIGSLFYKVKLVTTEHNTSNRRRSWKLFHIIDKWMYGRYSKIICISDKAEENLREYLNAQQSNNNICTIYNGVNVEKFHQVKATDGMHPEEKTVIIMVAAFRPQKDQKTLIDAISLLPNDKYELWLVGDGELHDEIHAYAKKLSNSFNEVQKDAGGIISFGNIKFFGNRQDVPEVLHTADIVVMSSHYEGLSLSSIEGMAVGKPFIASDVDGLREVTNGYGILFPHGDAKALAEEIMKLENEEYRKEVADRCWERAQMFDIQKMVDGYEEVYKSLNV